MVNLNSLNMDGISEWEGMGDHVRIALLADANDASSLFAVVPLYPQQIGTDYDGLLEKMRRLAPRKERNGEGE